MLLAGSTRYPTPCSGLWDGGERAPGVAAHPPGHGPRRLGHTFETSLPAPKRSHQPQPARGTRGPQQTDEVRGPLRRSPGGVPLGKTGRLGLATEISASSGAINATMHNPCKGLESTLQAGGIDHRSNGEPKPAEPLPWQTTYANRSGRVSCETL
ncbi:hypothetical protein CRENBAI_005575 [Crenichthys baileyi]|uniref:Uncharacterized protein n=1 Tax=Crenichthys baileyi TaxID=28760 RepID=A0AAV9SGL8_9TELE